MKVRFISKEAVDKVKYNSCVHYANNGNIFGYWWYLDAISRDWDILVEGDYESVMPLIWREEFPRTKVLYQPYLLRESGIYSINVLSPVRIQKFLEAIPEEYKKVNIHLNEQNTTANLEGFKKVEKTNHQMLLLEPYQKLKGAYSDALKAKLNKIEEQQDLLPVTHKKPEVIADFYKKYTPQQSGVNQNFHAIQRIMYNALHRGWGFTSSVLDKNKELLAANFFIYSHKKVLSLLPVVSPKGKECHALEYLMDMLIKSHENRPLILDFNTMEDSQLAKDFGARSNVFYEIQQDKRKWKFF